MKTQVALIAGFGINADQELALAFQRAGAETRFLHLEDIRLGIESLNAYQILAFPGGFAFGDHLGSGKVLAHIVRTSLRPQIDAFLKRGGLIIGICNGFQTLVKMGLLPNLEGDWTQDVSLVHNDGGRFIDRWVRLTRNPANTSAWLRGLNELYVPIRHGEGQLVIANDAVGQAIKNQNLTAFSYTDGAPNGSFLDIAGLTDTSGQVLGLMPHPECVLASEQRPDGVGAGREVEGLGLFYNAVQWVGANH